MNRRMREGDRQCGVWPWSWAVAWVMTLSAVPAWAQPADPPLRVELSNRTGRACFIAADNGAPAAGDHGKQAARNARRVPLAADAPIAFLRRHGHHFGLRDPDRQLVLRRAGRDALGHHHAAFQQVHEGVPVFAGVLRVHHDDHGAFRAANGDAYPVPEKLSTTPQLRADEAQQIALNAVAEGLPAVESTELTIVDPGWYGDAPRGAHLVWHVVLTDVDVPLREAFFINAHTGAILDRWSMIHDALQRQIHDAAGLPFLPGPIARVEGQPPTGVSDVNAAYDYARDTYDYYARAFGRDSLNDAGMTMIVTVRAGLSICPNAFWNGAQTVFCAGLLTDDILGHEFAHGVTEFTAGLIYQNQSGQLNESYSDIFGELIDLFNGDTAFPGPPGGTSWPTHATGPGSDVPNNLRSACSKASNGYANGYRWLMGEDSSLGAIRDMWSPTCFSDPDRAYSPYQTCPSNDSGGVHSGSGVPNHAFAIMTDGKTFNGQTVSAIGPIKAGAVWYRALTTYLTVAADFEDAYYALNAAAADLIGTDPNDPRTGLPSGDVFTAADAEQVDKAMLAVQMNTEGACGATVNVLDSTPPELCYPRRTIFADDFESGTNGWAVSNTGPPTPYDWTQTSGQLPFGRGGTVWFVEDRDIGNCGSQDESAVHHLTSPPIVLPAYLDEPMLAFTHYVATEPAWDGGNVKIRVNGGVWQLIPGSAFTYNAYNDTLNTSSEGNTNPLEGEAAWTGAGGTWGTSLVDLSGYVSGGETVQLRFEFGKDGCTGVDGWYLDNFEVYRCPPAPGDFDDDGDVDDNDASVFRACLSGAGVPAAPACVDADLDFDVDVDMEDHARFQRCLHGLGQTVDPHCAD